MAIQHLGARGAAGAGHALRVLLIHDPSPAWERLTGGLAREGLRVLTASTTDDALRRYRADGPDGVVLDCDATAFDALALCRAIRARTGPRGTPVLVMGSQRDDPLAVPAYAAGADSYVALPCAPAVLAVRLRALIGTAAAGAAATGAALGCAAERVLRVGGWELDPETQEARAPTAPRDEPVALTRAEFRLFYLLAANAGRTVPAGRLRAYAEIGSLRGHVSRLRRQLGLPAAGPGAIEAHEGVGYRYLPHRP